jgi:hypothetical protein
MSQAGPEAPDSVPPALGVAVTAYKAALGLSVISRHLPALVHHRGPVAAGLIVFGLDLRLPPALARPPWPPPDRATGGAQPTSSTTARRRSLRDVVEAMQHPLQKLHRREVRVGDGGLRPVQHHHPLEGHIADDHAGHAQ